MSQNQLVTQDTPTFALATDRLSTSLGIPKDVMLTTLKAQCFRGTNPENITNAQLAAFVSIANDMGVNPLLPGMLYAYPDRNGIIPIMGPDGVFKKLSERSDIDSWEVEVFPEDAGEAPTHAVAKIYRKGIDRPIKYVAHLSEWKVNSNPNWNSRPRHMLTIRALKQAARQIIHGLPGDEDDRAISAVNVTDSEPGSTPRPPAPKREPKGAAAVKENTNKPETIEVQATSVADKNSGAASAEQSAPAGTEESSAPASQGDVTLAAPVTSLKANERFTGKCEIVEFTAKSLKFRGAPTPSVVVKFRGGYEGTAYHFQTGAHLDGDGKVVANPEYQIERPVMVELLGVLNSANNTVIPYVQSIKEVRPAAQDENFG